MVLGKFTSRRSSIVFASTRKSTGKSVLITVRSNPITWNEIVTILATVGAVI